MPSMVGKHGIHRIHTAFTMNSAAMSSDGPRSASACRILTCPVGQLLEDVLHRAFAPVHAQYLQVIVHREPEHRGADVTGHVVLQQPEAVLLAVHVEHTTDVLQHIRRHGLVEFHLQQHALLWAAAQRTGLVVRHQFPTIDDDHTVADGLHLLHDVGAQHHGLLLAHALDQRAHLHQLIGVEATGRFVQDEHLRVMDHGLRQPDTLAIPFAQRADPLMPLGTEAHQLDHLPHPRTAMAKAMHAGHEVQVLGHVQVEVERVVLREVAHMAPYVKAVLACVDATHAGRAVRRGQVTGEDPHHRALPCTVGA